jgi:hypothetical protein
MYNTLSTLLPILPASFFVSLKTLQVTCKSKEAYYK